MTLFSIFVVIACGAHFLGRHHSPKLSSRSLSIALIGTFLLSSPPVAWLLSGSLEWWYTTNLKPADDPQVIVVLSGAAWPAGPHHPYALVRDSTVTRARHAAWLHTNWKPLPVLACGGPFSRGQTVHSVAKLMAELLAAWGVDETQIQTEETSRSTYEQAVRASELLRADGVHRVALVTEAYHMLRAEKTFRKAGLEVSAAPSGFRAAAFQGRLPDFLPNHQAIQHNNEALREWVAIAWYWFNQRL